LRKIEKTIDPMTAMTTASARACLQVVVLSPSEAMKTQANDAGARPP